MSELWERIQTLRAFVRSYVAEIAVLTMSVGWIGGWHLFVALILKRLREQA